MSGGEKHVILMWEICNCGDLNVIVKWENNNMAIWFFLDLTEITFPHYHLKFNLHIFNSPTITYFATLKCFKA
jgi:hypothetical protein